MALLSFASSCIQYLVKASKRFTMMKSPRRLTALGASFIISTRSFPHKVHFLYLIFAINCWLQYERRMKSQLTSWSLSDITRLVELLRADSSLPVAKSSSLGWRANVSLGKGDIVCKFYLKWLQTRITSVLYIILTTFLWKRPMYKLLYRKFSQLACCEISNYTSE